MTDDTRSSYDRLAQEYVNRIYDELRHKPFDRKMLDWLIEKTSGVICDMGCGPGQVARYLHDHGAKSCGLDLSAEMIDHARRLNPGIEFSQGDMHDLSAIPDGVYSGIAAFYCIIHIEREKVVAVLRELKRILAPDGVLLMSFHLGSEVRHFDELWGQPVSLDFIFFEREEMKTYLIEAGFQLEEVIERDPYPDIEVQTRRAYLFTRKA